MISKIVPPPLRKSSKTPEEMEEQRREEFRRERATFWESIVRKIGKRYGTCRLSEWTFHGTEVEKKNQKTVINQISDYRNTMPAHVAAGEGIMLFGPPGTGKDFLVSAVMREAVLRQGFRIEWCNGMDLFGGFRDAIGGGASEKSLVDRWASPEILVLSDPLPPQGPLTEYQRAVLFRIVDQRYRNQRPTWITINVDDSVEAEERMGTQVVSRLRHSSLVCRCEWDDFRAKS